MNKDFYNDFKEIYEMKDVIRDKLSNIKNKYETKNLYNTFHVFRYPSGGHCQRAGRESLYNEHALSRRGPGQYLERQLFFAAVSVYYFLDWRRGPGLCSRRALVADCL